MYVSGPNQTCASGSSANAVSTVLTTLLDVQAIVGTVASARAFGVAGIMNTLKESRNKSVEDALASLDSGLFDELSRQEGLAESDAVDNYLITPVVDVLHEKSGALVTRRLPTLKLYKIGVKLDMTGKTAADAKTEVLAHEKPERKAEMPAPDLSDLEVATISVVQEDLPLVERPFAAQAEIIGCSEDDVLEMLASFNERKLMRRFAAVMNHRSAGYKANAMGVWAVPEADLVAVVDERDPRAREHHRERDREPLVRLGAGGLRGPPVPAVAGVAPLATARDLAAREVDRARDVVVADPRRHDRARPVERVVAVHERRERVHAALGPEHGLAEARLDVLGAHELDPVLDQVPHHRLDVAADVADLCELRRLELEERRAGESRQPPCDLGLADAGRADHQDVLRQHLVLQVALELLPPPAVPERDGDRALGVVLADDVAIELGDDLAGREVGHRMGGSNAGCSASDE